MEKDQNVNSENQNEEVKDTLTEEQIQQEQGDPKEKNEDYVEVQLISYDCQDIKYCKEEKTFKGDACMPRMINNICECHKRNTFIINTIKENYYKVMYFYKCDGGSSILYGDKFKTKLEPNNNPELIHDSESCLTKCASRD